MSVYIKQTAVFIGGLAAIIVYSLLAMRDVSFVWLLPFPVAWSCAIAYLMNGSKRMAEAKR